MNKNIFRSTYLANTGTNIFGLKFFGKYKYEYILIPFFRLLQIYLNFPKRGEY